MAKKKTESSDKTEKKSAGGAKAKSTKKPAAKSKPAAGGGEAFGIDTNLAAAAAARMLAARNQLKTQGAGEKEEGSLVKQIKQNLNKPSASAMANLLDKTGGPGAKRPNLPFGGGNQVGHNQTTGGNVNRAVIPRRTGG